MKKKIISLFLFFLLFFSFFASTVQAQTDPTLDGLNKTASKIGAFSAQIGDTYDANFLATKAGQLIGTILAFIGVLFLILMIYAGLMWMTAGGNEQAVTKAKSLIINAATGLTIVLAAYALTAFIGNNLIQ
jgi:uncharacterized protein YggT (Ycf19 family)